ncbi:hypothetical protein [Flaviaesturariibacter amylovorans]|uniref:Outer membrane protein beta-barrel domain-containing protein n=1 Tax=Flaviaesturariibacter amylovorans TaxID=1084520 RepID=A0ABP8GH41_9BACT
MQENNFEKQVQQKMGELRFEPTTPVWAAVEARIRKKKERRRLLFWMFFGVLLLGGAGAWLLQGRPSASNLAHTSAQLPQTQPTTTPGTQTAAPATPSATGAMSNGSNGPADAGTTTATKETVLPTVATATGEIAVARTATASPAPATRATSEGASKARMGAVSPVRASRNGRTAARRTTGPATAGPVPAQHHADRPGANITTTNTAATKATTTTATADPAPGTTEATRISTAKAPTAGVPAPGADSTNTAATTPQAPDVAAAAAPPAAPQHRKARPFQWRVWAGAGRSAFTSPGPGTKSSYDVVQNTGGGVGSGSGNPPLSGSFSYPTPDRDPAASFQAGVSLIYPLSRNVQLEASIGYHYLSTVQQVGAFRAETGSATPSNSARTYYSYGSQTSYRNQFHTLQLPLQLGWKPHPRVTLTGGASISWLVATNALRFDEGNGRSYKDDSEWQRTGVSLLGGARYQFWKKGARSIDAGPVLQYGLSPLERSTGKRFSYIGLQAGFQF